MTYQEIIQTWLHQVRPTMVEGTGKSIPTAIKYRTLRICDNNLYIKEEPVLKYKYGLLFFCPFGHYSIKKILKELSVTDYIIEMESLADDFITRRVQDYVNAFIYHAERFNYINYSVGLKVHYMDDMLFQNCTPRVKYYRRIGPTEYDRARQRSFMRQRNRERNNERYILSGIWKITSHDF